MKTIKKVLLAIDGSADKQALVAEVSAIAQDAHVTLLSVLDPPFRDRDVAPRLADLQTWITEERLELMKDISSSLLEKGILATIKPSFGKPYLEIVREAMKDEYDLIMKPAKSETTLKSVLFGSTDMQIFRSCPYPVWIFKPTPNLQLRKIMVAVDLLINDEEKNALADKVLQWGRDVAEEVGAELHVVHIWSLYGELTLRGRSVSGGTVDKLVYQEKQEHLRLLNEALARNGLEQNRPQIHFAKGEATDLILGAVEAVKPDLLVMGTVGRTGIPGFFIGNTADSVLREVNCSVLAVKPDGFVTPVKLDG